LIVGHGRPVSAHTPNICYRASGFEMRAAENSLYPMAFPGQPEAPFWTNTFFKEDRLTGRRLIRVFWSWYDTENEENEGKVVWEAPENPRYHFGNTRALYKMYFTSEMQNQMETTEQSACLRFAREFLPVVNEALAAVHIASGTAATQAEQPAAPEASAEASSQEAVETPAEPVDLFDESPNPTSGPPREGASAKAPSTTTPASE
jgi:hypothetical protein